LGGGSTRKKQRVGSSVGDERCMVQKGSEKSVNWTAGQAVGRGGKGREFTFPIKNRVRKKGMGKRGCEARGMVLRSRKGNGENSSSRERKERENHVTLREKMSKSLYGNPLNWKTAEALQKRSSGGREGKGNPAHWTRKHASTRRVPKQVGKARFSVSFNRFWNYRPSLGVLETARGILKPTEG